MVETFTNALWLITAVLLVGMWRLRWSRMPRTDRFSRRSEILALICVISLLFPVISMSDDLHPAIVAMEDVVLGKRHLRLALAGVIHVPTAPDKVAHSTVAIFSRGLILNTFTAKAFSFRVVIRYSTIVPASLSGRSPPLSA